MPQTQDIDLSGGLQTPDDSIDLSAGITPAQQPKPTQSNLPALLQFAKDNALRVGSTTGGTHNHNSKHYSGNAIDVDYRGVDVDALSQAAAARGFKLRNEIARPKGQAVWGGPHLHLETDDGLDLTSGLGQTDSAGDSSLAGQPNDNQTALAKSQTPSLETANPASSSQQQNNTANSNSFLASFQSAQRRLNAQAPLQMNPRPTGVSIGDINWHWGMDANEFKNLSQQQQQTVIANTRKAIAIDEAKKAAGQTLTPSLSYINANRNSIGLPAKSIMSTSLPQQQEEGRSQYDLAPLLKRVASLPLSPNQIEAQKTASEVEGAPFGLRLIPAEIGRIAAQAERAGAGLADYAKDAGDAVGIPTGVLSDVSNYLKNRVDIANRASSYETQDAEDSLPKSVIKSIADTGADVGSIIAITATTGLPFPVVMAGEAALNNSDKSPVEIAKATALAYGMGKAYEYLPGKIASKLGIEGQLPTRVLGASLFGTAGVGQAAYSGGDTNQLISEGISQGAMGALGGPHGEEAPAEAREFTTVPKDSATNQTLDYINQIESDGHITAGQADKLRENVLAARDTEQPKAAFDNQAQVSAPQSKVEASATLTPEEIIKNITRLNSGQPDVEATKQLLGNKEYELKEIPIDEVKGIYGQPDPQTVENYAARNPETQPPIVLDANNDVIDGKRRLAASKLRGDETIKAWMPATEKAQPLEDFDNPTAQLAARGPGAANIGDVPEGSTTKQLTEAIENSDAAPRDKIDYSLNLADKLSRGKDAIEAGLTRSKALTQALWAKYKGPTDVADSQKILGDFQYKLQKSAFESRRFAKELEKKLSPAQQEAVTNYIQADGDTNLLKQRAASSEGATKKGYERATSLTGDERTIATHFSSAFESLFKEANDSGVGVSFIENYVPQIWKSKAAKVMLADAQKGMLDPSSKFSKKRVFDSYFEGEQAGYTPKTKSIGALYQVYSNALNKAIASRQYVADLQNTKASDGRPLVAVRGSGQTAMTEKGPLGQEKGAFIKPHSATADTSDYRVLDHPALRDWKYTTSIDSKPVMVQGDMAIHPEAFSRIRNVLTPSKIATGEGVGYTLARGVKKAQSVAKQTMLGFFSPFHEVQEDVHALGHRTLPYVNKTKINFDDPKQAQLVRRGLQVASFHEAEAFSEGLAGGNLTAKIPVIGTKILGPYQEWLFKDHIPNLKMNMALHALDRNMERYKGKLSEDRIYELTASQANNAFGELNYTYLARNQTTQDVLRMALLAPDFLEARAKFAGSALKPQGKEQLVALGVLAATQYITARVLNKLNDGDYHFEKESLFSVVHNGKRYGLRTVPSDILELTTDPRLFLTHRASPLTAAGVRAFTGKNEFGKPAGIVEQAKLLAEAPLPIQLKALTYKKEVTFWDQFLSSMGVRVSKAGVREFKAKPQQRGKLLF